VRPSVICRGFGTAASLFAMPLCAAVPSPPTTIVTPLPRTGVMTPQTITLRPMTPVETEANAIWNLRAGLNVAALQCQFSAYLATVKTYNDLLKHHSAELATAQTTMVAHFKRYDKARGLNSFDQYSTRVYNSYSTLDAQYSFCNAAAAIGRGTLLLDKSGLGRYALTQTPILRAALSPGAGSMTAIPVGIEPVALPPITE